MSEREAIELFIGLCISGLIGAAVAQTKQASSWQGFCWGFALGPIGWILAALVLKPIDKKAVASVSQRTTALADKDAHAKRALAARLSQLRKAEESKR